MNNRVTIEPTEFVNVRDGTKTYGVRVYDDFGQMYDNTWESIPKDDMKVLQKVLKSDGNEFVETMEFIKENEKDICIGGEYYKWEEIKKYFDEVNE